MILIRPHQLELNLNHKANLLARNKVERKKMKEEFMS
jgi:hypothetical protein